MQANGPLPKNGGEEQTWVPGEKTHQKPAQKSASQRKLKEPLPPPPPLGDSNSSPSKIGRASWLHNQLSYRDPLFSALCSVLCTVFTKREQFQVPLTQTTVRVRETTGTQTDLVCV